MFLIIFEKSPDILTNESGSIIGNLHNRVANYHRIGEYRGIDINGCERVWGVAHKRPFPQTASSLAKQSRVDRAY